ESFASDTSDQSDQSGGRGQDTQSVAVLGMRNGTSQSPFRPALGRQLVRAADA
ncbi:MAG: hypothetical protein, partial [Olavius algarvensis Gamma 1 endosymbiont]